MNTPTGGEGEDKRSIALPLLKSTSVFDSGYSFQKYFAVNSKITEDNERLSVGVSVWIEIKIKTKKPGRVLFVGLVCCRRTTRPSANTLPVRCVAYAEIVGRAEGLHPAGVPGAVDILPPWRAAVAVSLRHVRPVRDLSLTRN